MPRLPKEKAISVKRIVREMDRANPGIAKAAQDIEDAKRAEIEGRRHPIPCQIPNCKWHTP